MAVDDGSLKTVLLVDDEQCVRRMLENCLRSAGFRVVTAECGLTAMEMIERNNIGVVDVLVTDVEMPNIDGITLAESCKRHFPDLRVVAMSGFTDRVLPLGSTIDVFVEKPFPPKALVHTLLKVLRQTRRR